MKFEYIFSEPACPFVCKECEVRNAIKTKLNGRQATVDSGLKNSKRSLFSLIIKLIDFRKYRNKVLFHKNVISTFFEFFLCLCQELNCLMTGSKFL